MIASVLVVAVTVLGSVMEVDAESTASLTLMGDGDGGDDDEDKLIELLLVLIVWKGTRTEVEIVVSVPSVAVVVSSLPMDFSASIALTRYCISVLDIFNSFPTSDDLLASNSLSNHLCGARPDTVFDFALMVRNADALIISFSIWLLEL